MRLQYLNYIALVPLLLVYACDLPTDADYEPPEEKSSTGQPELTAAIAADTGASIGDTVRLRATVSTDIHRDSLTYHWRISHRPESSTAGLSDTADTAVMLAPDSLGRYSVQLTVSNGTLSDTATTDIRVGIETLGSITEDRVLEDLFEDSLQADYYVQSHILVGAILTVKPGVRIEIAESRTILIGADGALIARGAAGDSVTFTSDDVAGGKVWGGLLFESSDTRNALSFAGITHAGGADMFRLYEGYNNDVAATIALDGDARLNIMDSRISHGAGFGIVLNESAAFDTFSTNRLYANKKADIFIPAKELTKITTATVYDDSSTPPMFLDERLEGDTSYIDSSIDLSSHIRKVVRVYSSSVPAGEKHTWHELGSDGTFYFSGTVTINGQVSIEDDAVIEVAEDKFITVGKSGLLEAHGAPEQPVTFTSAAREGNVKWGGLHFLSSDTRNEFNYTRVEYGGGADAFWLYSGYNDNVAANIALEDGARLSINNSYIANSGAIGLVVDEQARTSQFGYNIFADNAREAVVTNAASAGTIDSLTRWKNNGTDAVRIYRSTVSRDEGVEWVALHNGAPWLFSGKTTISAPLTIAPGALLHFRDDVQLNVSTTGSISAVGTPADSIVFTSANESGGTRWAGIRIASNDAANALEYARVSYGGDGDSPFWLYGDYNQDGQTNIGLDESAQLSITNSTVANSGKFGITVNEGATLNGLDDSVADGPAQIAAQNGFHDNAEDDVAFE